MQRKLTIRLDDRLIRKAKDYARESRKSLSRLVAEYFGLLRVKPNRGGKLTPAVKSLKGALKGSSITKGDYRRHLEEKYL